MTDEERKKFQDFLKELMVLQGQAKDISSSLTRWNKRFWKFYKKISDKLNGK